MSSTALLDIIIHSGPKKENSYIVLLKTHVEKASFLRHAVATYPSFEVTADWDPGFLNGFVVVLEGAGLAFLRSSADVLSIEEDGKYQAFTSVTQADAPWGLARISQDDRLNRSPTALDYKYKYDDVIVNVDAYVIDTGIRITHEDFQGRARWGKTFGPYKDADGNGHGTHVAAILGGHRWGVAKTAILIAVKVLSDDGFGFLSDIISGVEYVAKEAERNGDRASVTNMSLGWQASISLDTAVTRLVNKGVTVVVAAGNNNGDAKEIRPARCEAAITVGATNIRDARADFSNYGSVVDIFAPGETITSAGIDNDTASRVSNGTSMATPHVAGLAAYLIARTGKNIKPPEVKTMLANAGLSGKLSNIPDGTKNLLARNDQ